MHYVFWNAFYRERIRASFRVCCLWIVKSHDISPPEDTAKGALLRPYGAKNFKLKKSARRLTTKVGTRKAFRATKTVNSQIQNQKVLIDIATVIEYDHSN